jgi:transcriptional regulator
MSKGREIRQLHKDLKTTRAEISALQKKLTAFLLKRKQAARNNPTQPDRNSS